MQIANEGDQSGQWGKDSFMTFNDKIDAICDVGDITKISAVTSHNFSQFNLMVKIFWLVCSVFITQ